MECFSLKTRIISGSGVISQLKEFGAKRVLVVSDPFFQKNGWAQRVAQATGAAQFEIFSEVAPDPSLALAARGTARLKEFGADLVVALGGGSAMDLAKAMVYFSRLGCPLAAVPTTSGSGSEVTNFAILTHEGTKHPLVDEALIPAAAVLDSDLLQELPRSLIADAGFDILAHAVESCCAKGAGAVSGLFAKEAFRGAYAALPASFSGRKEVRLKVHLAAALAGVAFTHSGLGLCHALSHSLGGLFHVPHGRLNAILLPAVMDCNAGSAGKAYADLARYSGIVGSADAIAYRNLKNGLIRLRSQLELPQTLSQAGIQPRELWSKADLITKTALEDPCCASNPVAADDFLIRRILEEVAGRG